MAADGNILEETDWYLREQVFATSARPHANVNYFIKEREDMVYAAKRVPSKIRANHPDLRKVRRGLNFWGQFIAVEFLKKLLTEWKKEMIYGFRTSVEEEHGYYPKLFLGDIS